MRGGDNWVTGTYEHHPLGNVIGLHKRILVEPQLLWLNHSLKGLQELRESVVRKRNTGKKKKAHQSVTRLLAAEQILHREKHWFDS